MTTDVIVKHWNEISLCRARIFPACSRCPRITLFDSFSTADPDPIHILKSYHDIEGFTLFLLPMLKKYVVVSVSLLFMIFIFNFRIIFRFRPILTFKFSLFIVNSILTFYRCCYYFI